MAFNDYDFSISANGSTQIHAMGSAVRVRSCTGQLRISVDGGSGVKLNAGQGFHLDGGSFRELTVRDVSGAPNAGVIFVGDGSYDDQTFSGSVSISNTSGAFAQGAQTTTNSVGGAVIAAASLIRRYLMVQNSDAVASVWVTLDGSAPTTTNGIKLLPGGVLELQGFVPNGQIRAIADQASAALVVVGG